MTQFNGIDVAVTVDTSGSPIAVATDASVLAVKAAVQAVTAAIQAQTDLTALFVTDGTSYYVRREVVNEGTGAVAVSFLNLDGSVPNSAPSVASLRPINTAGLQLDVAQFDVVTAGTGTAVGDVISRVLIFNTASPASAPTAAWLNLTQGTVLTTAPAAGAYVEPTKNLTVAGGSLTANLDGADPGAPVQANAGTGSRGWLATIAGLLRLGTATKANSASVTVGTDQGNLEPGGAPITGSAMPAGGTGLTGWLSAIWSGNVSRNVYSAQKSTSVAANGLVGTSYIALGASPSPYTSVVATIYCNVSGATSYLEISDGTGSYANIQTGALTAGVPLQIKVPAAAMAATGTQFRAYIQNGSNASNLAFVSVALVTN